MTAAGPTEQPLTSTRPPDTAEKMICYVHGRSDVGRVREGNEDSFRVSQEQDGSWNLVVCDGMGGHEAGEVASAVAVERLLSDLQEREAEPPGLAILHAIHAANQEVLSEAARRRQPDMGTTTVVARVLGASCWVGWVGDSRLTWLREGRVIESTVDHTRVQQLVELGVLTPREARDHPESHILIQALGGGEGAQQNFQPTVWEDPLELLVGDVVILASDGLWDLVSPEEIPEIIGGCDYAQAVEALIAEANARGGHDNITCVVVVAGQPQVPPWTVSKSAEEAASPRINRGAVPRRRLAFSVWVALLGMILALIVGILIGVVAVRGSTPDPFPERPPLGPVPSPEAAGSRLPGPPQRMVPAKVEPPPPDEAPQAPAPDAEAQAPAPGP